VLGKARGLGSAGSLMKGEAARGAAAGGGRAGNAPGQLFAVSFLPVEPSGLYERSMSRR